MSDFQRFESKLGHHSHAIHTYKEHISYPYKLIYSSIHTPLQVNPLQWSENVRGWNNGAPQHLPRTQFALGSIPDHAGFFSIVEFQCFNVRLPKVYA